MADFFDRLMVRPEAHEFEFIDMTSAEALPTDGFEEVSFLDKAVGLPIIIMPKVIYDYLDYIYFPRFGHFPTVNNFPRAWEIP